MILIHVTYHLTYLHFCFFYYPYYDTCIIVRNKVLSINNLTQICLSSSYHAIVFPTQLSITILRLSIIYKKIRNFLFLSTYKFRNNYYNNAIYYTI